MQRRAVMAHGWHAGVAFGGGTYGATARNKEVLAPRAISLTQDTPAGEALPERLAYGHATLSVEQIKAGGFDHLSLFGDIRAQGDVTLRMDQSLRIHGLNERALGVAEGNQEGSRLLLSAPYVRLAQGAGGSRPGKARCGRWRRRSMQRSSIGST